MQCRRVSESPFTDNRRAAGEEQHLVEGCTWMSASTGSFAAVATTAFLIAALPLDELPLVQVQVLYLPN